MTDDSDISRPSPCCWPMQTLSDLLCSYAHDLPKEAMLPVLPICTSICFHVLNFH